MLRLQQMTREITLAGERTYLWIFALTTGLLYAAAVLRTLLRYAGTPVLVRFLVLLLAFLLALLGERVLSSRKRLSPSPNHTFSHQNHIFLIYLGVQTILVCTLLYLPGLPESEFFAVLFAILSMQATQRLEAKASAAWIGLFTALMAVAYIPASNWVQGLAITLLYTGANIMLASFVLATKRAQAASTHNRALVSQLQAANHQLQEFTAQAERLAVARERARLARELHDSVTQTLFSMNLASQTAEMLLARQPDRIAGQLERLNSLAQSAQTEMRMLISELGSETTDEHSLVERLRRQLAVRKLRDGLEVSLDIVGEETLPPVVEQRLFGIIHEALNNTMKHAQVSEACVHFHLDDPIWVEVEDYGVGFEPARSQASGVGLAGMRERAAEIGWELEVHSAPGAGTRIRVSPAAHEKRQAE